jgi:valyl-tRNA synthetase
MVAPYPVPDAALPRDAAARESVDDLIEIVARVRSVRTELGISPTQPLTVVAQTRTPEQARTLSAPEQRQQILRLGRIGELTLSPAATRPRGAMLVPSDRLRAIWIVLAGVIDPVKEKSRLGTEMAKTAAEAERIAKRLADPGFAQRAPEEVRLKDEARVAELDEKRRRIEEHLAGIEELLG